LETEDTEDKKLTTTEMDRLNRVHGKIHVYKKGILRKEFMYISNVLQWSQRKNADGIYTNTYWYRDSDEYKTEVCDCYDGLFSQCSYKNDMPNGLRRYYDNNEMWNWTQYLNGTRHGVYITWHSNGARSYMGRYFNGHPYGTHYRWADTGQLEEKVDYEIHTPR
jgi:antitoxin component YwqK of YwqJK toxin-antitoxin module